MKKVKRGEERRGEKPHCIDFLLTWLKQITALRKKAETAARAALETLFNIFFVSSANFIIHVCSERWMMTGWREAAASATTYPSICSSGSSSSGSSGSSGSSSNQDESDGVVKKVFRISVRPMQCCYLFIYLLLHLFSKKQKFFYVLEPIWDTEFDCWEQINSKKIAVMWMDATETK